MVARQRRVKWRSPRPPEAGPPSAEKLFMFTVYILESTQFGKLYTGLTDDLTNRLKKHNAGGVRSTKAYKPYKIIHTEHFTNKTEARRRELFLKSGQGRKWIKENRASWRDGRVVDGGRLESDYTLTGIGGSNPPPSVVKLGGSPDAH